MAGNIHLWGAEEVGVPVPLAAAEICDCGSRGMMVVTVVMEARIVTLSMVVACCCIYCMAYFFLGWCCTGG